MINVKKTKSEQSLNCFVCDRPISAGQEYFIRGEKDICSKECLEKRMYIVYDGRANSGETDDSVCLEALGYCTNKQEAVKDAMESWEEVEWALYSYLDTGEELVDEKFEYSHYLPEK